MFPHKPMFPHASFSSFPSGLCFVSLRTDGGISSFFFSSQPWNDNMICSILGRYRNLHLSELYTWQVCGKKIVSAKSRPCLRLCNPTVRALETHFHWMWLDVWRNLLKENVQLLLHQTAICLSFLHTFLIQKHEISLKWVHKEGNEGFSRHIKSFFKAGWAFQSLSFVELVPRCRIVCTLCK